MSLYPYAIWTSDIHCPDQLVPMSLCLYVCSYAHVYVFISLECPGRHLIIAFLHEFTAIAVSRDMIANAPNT